MVKSMLDFLSEYIELKRNHPGTVLFFLRGDFYELYLDDATEAACVLGTTLVPRQGVVMTGVPWHGVSKFLGKMIRAGRTVAVCESQGAKYEVVRLVSPGHVRSWTEDDIPRPLPDEGSRRTRKPRALLKQMAGLEKRINKLCEERTGEKRRPPLRVILGGATQPQ